MRKIFIFSGKRQKSPNELVKTNITSIKLPKALEGITVANPNWRMVVKTLTGMQWSGFFNARSVIPE